MFKQSGRIALLLLIAVTVVVNYQPQVGRYASRILTNLNIYGDEEPVRLESGVTPAPAAEADQSVMRQFRWQTTGKNWSWQIPLSRQGYEYFKKLPRVQSDDYSVYVTNTADDVYLSELVQRFRDVKATANLTEYEMVAMVVAFVQSIPYVEDIVGTGQEEYPKYPIETLYEQSGDCEDKSILMASLLDKLGYGAILLALPNHMAVGVKGSNSLPGTYVTYEGERFYYLETTGSNWEIGDAPSEVVDSKVRILALTPRPVLIHQWESSGSVYNYRLTVIVENQGTAAATDTSVYAAFDAGGDQVYAQATSEEINIPPGGKATFQVKLDYPPRVRTRIQVKIIADGALEGESASDWFTTQ